jgi:hypothetical protein
MDGNTKGLGLKTMNMNIKNVVVCLAALTSSGCAQLEPLLISLDEPCPRSCAEPAEVITVGDEIVKRCWCPPGTTRDPVVVSCISNSDCRGGDVCVRVITTDSTGVRRDGKQCSRFCSSDFDCPSINSCADRVYAGACYMISTDPDFRNFTCFARCDSDIDCDFNQDCVPVTGPTGADAICLPKA